MRYAPRRSDDGDLRSRLREIAAERRRFGYRRLGIMLAREGLVMNHKKLLRLYREENLRVRRRRGRKRAMGTRAPMTLPQGPNQRWSLDFVSDTLISGRRIRILAVVDDFTRECLALVVDTSLSGARVARGRRALLECEDVGGAVAAPVVPIEAVQGFVVRKNDAKLGAAGARVRPALAQGRAGGVARHILGVRQDHPPFRGLD